MHSRRWANENMMRAIPFLILIAAYGLGCVASSVVMRSTGNHEYFNSQVALRHLHPFTQRFVDTYGLPDPDELNRLIAARWRKDSNATNYEEPQTEEESELHFIAECANDHALHVWMNPPRFIQSKALPDGFGFFLEGEDGISISRGEDRDDINSWNRSSIRFYQTRMRNHRLLRDNVVGAFLATVAGLMLFALDKKTKKPNKSSLPTGRNSKISTPIALP
jgi:hypothetical protein